MDFQQLSGIRKDSVNIWAEIADFSENSQPPGKDLGDLYTESGQTSQCSFSSVSTPPIARVGAFFSINFFANYKIFTPSHRSEPKISAKKCHIFFIFLQKILKIKKKSVKFC